MSTSMANLIPFDDAPISPANWTNQQENVFIDLLVRQVQNGGMVAGCLKTQAWKEVRVGFYRALGLKFNTKSFSNKIQDLKSRYKEFKKLRFGQTGFGWDEEKKIVVASPDTWKSYLMVNPKAKRFRTKGCPEYDRLDIIFGGTIAIGQFGTSLARGVQSPPRDEVQVSNNDQPVEESLNPMAHDIGDVNDSDDEWSSTATTRRDVRRKITIDFVDIINKLNEAANARIDKLVDAINGFNDKPDKYSISTFLDEINTMEGLTHIDYCKLFEVFEKASAREWYMKMPPDIRRNWISDILKK
ncbi:PREDICTED: L10-interacting MYB domain-containing protein-like [Nelumbo nucifera]|uniref:Myb/SANT-like domain-containing protein n=2 Tax=Nelumbo nucifera TaxID=4432 RepID=A0A822ZPR2_NELNU|nr:PREDICTED: L10-interacting MYB domain-containing protein-like [Nelumbo nucifera]DAD45339.1 TPA_asm: hypothetical protein HUJ06_003569 [Nelumbo nucifera]